MALFDFADNSGTNHLVKIEMLNGENNFSLLRDGFHSAAENSSKRVIFILANCPKEKEVLLPPLWPGASFNDACPP